MINIYTNFVYLDHRMKKCREVHHSQFPFRLNKSDELKVTRREEGVKDPFCSLRF